jgi:hypothetical protein
VYSTVYPLIADVPGAEGAVHDRAICALPAVADRLVGAFGGVPDTGVTLLLAEV